MSWLDDVITHGSTVEEHLVRWLMVWLYVHTSIDAVVIYEDDSGKKWTGDTYYIYIWTEKFFLSLCFSCNNLFFNKVLVNCYCSVLLGVFVRWKLYTLSGETLSGETIRRAKFSPLNENFVTFARRKFSPNKSKSVFSCIADAPCRDHKGIG